MFIGECIASLDLNSEDVKRFVIKLQKFDSVVSLFQILYTVMQRNPGLFKIIANPSLLDLEYDKACHQPSYYDHNTDLGFKYATIKTNVKINKDDFMGFVNHKIVCSTSNKLETFKQVFNHVINTYEKDKQVQEEKTRHRT